MAYKDSIVKKNFLIFHINNRFRRSLFAFLIAALSGCGSVDERVVSAGDDATAEPVNESAQRPTENASSSPANGGVEPSTEAPNQLGQLPALPTLSTADRGGPRRSGGVSTALTRSAPTECLRLKLSGEVLSSPAALDDSLVFATRNGRVISVDARSGEKQWTTRTLAIRGSGPAIGAGAVFVAEIARRGSLIALDLESGERRWAKQIGPTTTSPLLVGNRVFISSEQLGGLAAYDTQTGERLWLTKLQGLRGSTAGDEERVLQSSSEGLVALSTADGRELWSSSFGEPSSPPAMLGPVVGVSLESGSVLLLRSVDGSEIWRVDDLGEAPSMVALDQERLYLTSGDELLAFDIQSGSRVWRAAALNGALPSIAGDVLVISLTENQLGAFDTRTGEELWQLELERVLGASPVVVSSRLFVPLRVDMEGESFMLAYE